MFCNYCGTRNPDGAKFCSNCGAPLNNTQQADPAANRPPYGTYQNQQDPAVNQRGSAVNRPVMGLSMGWHKFLVYFALWAGAILNFYYAVTAFTGLQYTYDGENISELVYETFNGLKAVDICYGVLVLALAGFGIYTAYSMLTFKRGAPRLLTTLYITSGVISVVYSLTVMAIISNTRGVNASTINSGILKTLVGTLVVSLVFLIINTIYYRNRAHLFVN